jgi:DNA modification methylase
VNSKPYYQDEAVTIYHADCRDVLPTLEPVDLVLTDPPYGIFKEAITRGFMVDRSGQDATEWDTKPSPETLLLALSFATHSVVWGYNYMADILGTCAAPFVWDKQTGANYFADGELAWTSFSTGTLRIFRHQWCGAFKASERGIRSLHPTQKPVALMRWCIERTPLADTILDPFMGSGTTLRAAKDLGRKAIGIEVEERYCEIAAKRMSQLAMALS